MATVAPPPPTAVLRAAAPAPTPTSSPTEATRRPRHARALTAGLGGTRSWRSRTSTPDGGAIGGSLLLALLLLLLIGFIGELFNNTVENNYDVIAAWFKQGPLGRIRGALGRIRIDPPGRPGVLLFIALTALISSFVDRASG